MPSAPLVGAIGADRIHSRFEHCHEEAAQRIVESGSRLWVFFIPLFTFARRYVMMCSHCGWTVELSREAAMHAADLAAQSRPPAA